MVFSSSIFLLYFLPIFLIVYQFLRGKLKNYWILIASVLFYSWGAPKFVLILLISTIIDFFIVRGLHNAQETKRRKLLLRTSISLNLGLLIYFKYANFFVENFNAVIQSIGFESVGWTSIALPIGISFYTFQTLTYSIDVYRKQHDPLDNVFDYLLYIMSFPQMIAGPIVRFNLIADQIKSRVETIDDKLLGLYRFIIGLAKKVLIANVMAEQADLIIDSKLYIGSWENAWIGILAYTFQIYFDFSGYSDMAIGLGRMIGFRFPENFNSPYTSSSISEFWRRWHMTLGGFMRDYLYIPLGGNRVETTSRLYFNLWFVFLLSGLWHGASWNFVLWGAYHGVFLVMERIFLKSVYDKVGKLPSMMFTFLVVVIGWVIFRIETVDEIGLYLQSMFDFGQVGSLRIIPEFVLIGIIALIFSFLVLFKFGRKLQGFFFEKETYSIFQHAGVAFLTAILFVLSVSSVVSSDFNPFIYFRF